MSQIPTAENNRMSLRINSKEKSLLIRAASLQQINLTEFVTRTVISAAHKIIDQHEQIKLTEKDSFRILELLENPPKPNKKLLAAARALARQ